MGMPLITPPRNILLIAGPVLGDVFLSTPLARALKLAYPKTQIDVLVRPGSEALVLDNPDISKVIHFSGKKEKWWSFVRLLRQIFHHYDLAVSTSSSDRSFGAAIIASSQCASVIPPLRITDWWKYLGCRYRVVEDKSTHIILQGLRIADALGIPRHYDLTIPQNPNSASAIEKLFPIEGTNIRYAVVHMTPGGHYKIMPPHCWIEIITYLRSQGLTVVLTGGNAPQEHALADQMVSTIPGVVSLVGKLTFASVAELITQAKLFVGVDTSTSHLAAATGTPTVVIYGPSNVVEWGPWPKEYREDRSPFIQKAGVQRVGNVTIVVADCKCWPFIRSCKVSEPEKNSCLVRFNAKVVIDAIKEGGLIKA